MRKEYVKPLTKVVKVCLEGEVLAGLVYASGGAEEALGKENIFDWDEETENLNSDATVWED